MFALKRKLIKIYQTGPKACWRIVANRAEKRHFAHKHKMGATQKKAAHCWQGIEQHCGIHFDSFLKRVKKLHLFFLDDYCRYLNVQEVLLEADHIISGRWPLFNQTIKFSGEKKWHTDFLHKNRGAIDYMFDDQAYFDDIQISPGETFDHVKDVRVVWELNRLQVLGQLGFAYQKTNDTKYVHYFTELIDDWQKQNPYLLGANWLCPMEVSIRAINLIVAFDYFKHAHIDDVFWQSYICLLYDHMHFLEHNWEYYDGRTSNHYLSDLVGYFYLTWFFDDLQGIATKQDWVIAEMYKEWDKQIQSDGTSYEGSTAYHILVTELFYLYYVLCDQMHVKLPQAYMQKLQHMFHFVNACKMNEQQSITIGDNDSGKVLWCSLPNHIIEQMKSKTDQSEIHHFANFGLSIIKNKTWHVSLRHHAYQNRQPSGHFHNDAGNVTLAIDGIPILVDPGSYCYTASAEWRNHFRSAEQHNMPFLKDHEPVKFDERLFALALPEAQKLSIADKKILQTSQRLYDRFGLTLTRKLNIENNVLVIRDFAQASSSKIEDLTLRFNFVFAPEISLKKVDGGWLILHQSRQLCMLKTELDFVQNEAWVSNHYSQKTNTSALRSISKLADKVLYTCMFEKISPSNNQICTN